MNQNLVALFSIMEDLPYADNRVLPGPGFPSGEGAASKIEYEIRPPDRKRLQAFQKLLKGRFRQAKPTVLKPSESNSAMGHICGTCRFGVDPKTSCLDPTNRAWGLDNLYVVDTSFLPSSAGINPSLTIAANALRVSEVIAQRL